MQVGVPSAGPLAGIEEVQEKLGLFAPRHGTVYAVIFASALSVSSAIFLILQLDRPFEGLMAMSDAPLRAAIAELNR